MKILTIATLFPNNVQPVHGLFVKERIKALAKLCQLKIMAPVPFFPPLKLFHKYYLYSQVKKRENIEGLDVLHPRFFTIPRLVPFLDGFFFFLSLLPRIIRIRKNFPFDAIDVHIAYPEGFGAVLLAKLFRKPVTVTVRGHDINDFPKSYVKRKMITYALRNANKVIAVCNDLKWNAVTLGVPEGKISVIPNGVDVSKFHPIDKEKARKELGLPLDQNIILSVGHLQELKGFHHLIDAVSLIKEEIGNILLVIVGGEQHGDKNFRPQLEKQIEHLKLHDHVRLVGAKLHHELFEWYSAADLFCLASSSEGWPNVIFEALSCGKPVVATSVGGIPEIIYSDEYGILVKQRNGLHFAKAILTALKKKWDEEKLIEYARENTWDNVALKVYKELQTIVAQSCQRSNLNEV